MVELGSQSGFYEVKTGLMCSSTSNIPFGILVEIYEFLPCREEVIDYFQWGKKVE